MYIDILRRYSAQSQMAIFMTRRPQKEMTRRALRIKKPSMFGHSAASAALLVALSPPHSRSRGVGLVTAFTATPPHVTSRALCRDLATGGRGLRRCESQGRGRGRSSRRDFSSSGGSRPWIGSSGTAGDARKTRKRRRAIGTAAAVPNGATAAASSSEQDTEQEGKEDSSSGGGSSSSSSRQTDRGGVSGDRLAFPELNSGGEVNRLFSNLEPCDITGFRRKATNLGAATALVGGTTVGAGILGLPAVTLEPGFIPSTVALVGMWLYMVSSGLLIAEVNVNLICRQGQPGMGLLKLAEQAVGPLGARVAGLTYVFIHYALLVAYMAQGGALLAEGAGALTEVLHLSQGGAGQGEVAAGAAVAVGGAVGETAAAAGLPASAGPVAFVAMFGGLLTLGSEELVENVNNAFVAVVLVSFGALLVAGAGGVQPDLLLRSNVGAVSTAIPTMFVALVFHNVVPTITTQLEGDVAKIRQAIVVGSAVPLLMFVAWNAIVLGSVDPSAANEAALAGKVFDPLAVLRSGSEGSYLVSGLVSTFSEFAIVTSFVGFVVGLIDFFQDIFNVPVGDTVKEKSLYALILIPPLGVAVTNPEIFFAALDNAGTFGISLLFGVLPACMAWNQRYRDDDVLATLPLVPGGKVTLTAMIGIAGAVIAQKLVSFIPH